MTGIEAVANGVQAFREPVARNAAKVLTWLAVLLGGLFIGITTLAGLLHVVPVEYETIVSQLARATLGRGLMYYAV